MKNILIISPAYPTAINGLGDYSYLLGKELAKNSHLKIVYAGLTQKEVVDVSPYQLIDSSNLHFVTAQLSISIVYLNYVNYAYHQKGIPFWLLQQLNLIKKKGVKIIIFFHELNATSYKPWQSVFWLKPLQQYLYKKLYSIADFCFCSNDRVLNILIKGSLDHGKKIKNIGIFSNIPEPKMITPFDKKNNIAIVFGSYGRRLAVYKSKTLSQFLIDYAITEIIDIGAGEIINNIKHIPIPVIRKGKLIPQEISDIFLSAKYGIIDYPESLLGKSGIFSAYAAFQLLVVNTNINKEIPLENLSSKTHYLSINEPSNLPQNLGKIATQLFDWYQPRSLKNHSEIVIDCLIHI